MNSLALIFIKIAVVTALLGGVLFGVHKVEQHVENIGYDRRAGEDKSAMDEQKAKASAELAALTKEKLEAATQLANLKTQLENQREIQQTQVRSAVQQHIANDRLHFTTNKAAGCGSSGPGTGSPAPGPASDTSTTVVQLPGQINDDLWKLAGDAESLKVDYGVLYAYTHNPKMVCELRQ